MGDLVVKGITRNSGSKLEKGQDENDDPVGLLQTLETSLDDIRSLITCRVCVRPLFEPYTIECGHTFCYGCLVRWFERDRTKKSCPDCRADVPRPPAPAYLVWTFLCPARRIPLTFYQVRDMTHIFANRAELMPVGETTQEHKKWQEEEAALVERDRATNGHKGGLFRGCFRLTRRRQLPVIRDEEDGVDRCPRCSWEIEDGLCESCGYLVGDDSADMSDSDGQGHWDQGQWDDDLYDLEETTLEDLVGDLGEDADMRGYLPNSDYSNHGYSSEDDSFQENPPRMRQGNRRIMGHLRPLPAHPVEEPPYDSLFDDTDDASADDETGSLDSFVVDDVEDGPYSVASSPRRLHWDTDEGTDGEGSQPQNSENHHNSQDGDGSVGNERSISIEQYDPEDESDEGPIIRSRRQARRRSVASNQSSASDGSGISGTSQALDALHAMRNRYSGSRVPANAQRNIPHRNLGAMGGRSTGGPIEIESDSDSPVPAHHARRRRAIPNHLSSEDDSDVEVSSGTATVGRDSPKPVARLSARSSGSNVLASQTSNASSPILIDSSPTRSTVPGAFPRRSRSDMSSTSLHANNPRHIGRAHPNRGVNNSPQGMSARRSPATASPSNGLQQRRGTQRRSPYPTRPHPRSPTSRQAHSPNPVEMVEQGRRDRQLAKTERRAERRRLKAEREQRGRPRNGVSPSARSSNQ